jgi:hypothetical protein
MEVPGVTRNRGTMVVRLKRTNTDTAPEGIYWCSVEDAASTSQTVYVGLYNTGGNPWSLNVHYTGALLYTQAVCISTGGPATTVTWTRDFTTVTQGTQTVLNDGVTAQYIHTIIYVTPSFFICFLPSSSMLPHVGPTELTANRFWEMVWDYQTPTIVMLTRCVEDGKVCF